MDTATQNQYYDSYAKVQVLTTSHRCKVRTDCSWNPGLKFIFLDLQSFHQFRDWNVGAHNGAQLKAVDEFQLGSLALKNLSSIWIQYLWISSEKKTVLLFYVSGASIQIFLAENWSLCISKFNLNKSTRSQKFSFFYPELSEHKLGHGLRQTSDRLVRPALIWLSYDLL